MLIRAFLALNFSVAVTRQLAEEVERRKARVAEMAQVAWVPAANYHLTLKFLGGVEEEALDALRDTLRMQAAAHAPFAAHLRGLGAFPSVEQPRVLWVGADGGEPLPRLVEGLEGALAELGFPREERPYHPHVTVGRVRETRGPLDWQGEIALGSSTFTEVVLYESRSVPNGRNGRKGAEYVARARVPLAGVERMTRRPEI